MTALRVGILSAAHVHTAGYAAAIAARDDVDFAGVVDHDAERGRATAERHGTDYVPESAADAFLDRIDAAVVCAPNAAHREWIERAVDAGVHVLCEKPLAPAVAAAETVVDVWEAGDVHVGVAMPLRFSGPAGRVEGRLTDAVGDLVAISGTNRGSMPGGWFVDPEQSGGGAVMDHTVHIVDLVYHLTGQLVAEVYAEVDTRFHDIPTDDVNVLSMELADGTPFLLDGSWSRPDEYHTWGDAAVEFTGTDGTVSLDCTGQRIWHTDRDDEAPDAGGVSSVTAGTDTTAALVADLIRAVREDRPMTTTPDEGVLSLAAVEAAYASAESGQVEKTGL